MQRNGGFYFTGNDHESLLTRTKDFFDNATPSGNSVAADVLLKLAAVLDRSDYRKKAEDVFSPPRASEAIRFGLWP
jgi:uncharacterized protein YyaL (SSP411 family)